MRNYLLKISFGVKRNLNLDFRFMGCSIFKVISMKSLSVLVSTVIKGGKNFSLLESFFFCTSDAASGGFIQSLNVLHKELLNSKGCDFGQDQTDDLLGLERM